MSKIFLGLSFVVAGMMLQVIEMMTQYTTSAVVPLFAGALVGSGGILVIWYIADHLAAGQASRTSGSAEPSPVH